MLGFNRSLFNPIGMLTPFPLKPKLLIQELWQKMLEGEEVIPRHTLQRRSQWKFSQIQTIDIQRWYGFNQQLNNLIVQNFCCDALSLGYGVITFLRVTAACVKVIVHDDIMCSLLQLIRRKYELKQKHVYKLCDKQLKKL